MDDKFLMEHSRQIGELTATVKHINSSVEDLTYTVKEYMKDGHEKRAEVDVNTKFRLKHQDMLEGVNIGRIVAVSVIRTTLALCMAIGAVTGALWGINRVKQEQKECPTAALHIKVIQKKSC
jgi:hypothetical protein